MSSADKIAILDRGFGAATFAQVVDSLLPVLPSVHALFAQRTDFSTRFLYRHLVPRLLEVGAGPILMPLRRPLEANLEPSVLYKDVPLQIERLSPGKLYQFSGYDIYDAAKFLDYLYRSMMAQPSPRPGTILLVECPEPLGDALEIAVRRFVQGGATLGTTVWLHYALPLVPRDMLGQMGSVCVFLPSKQDVQILSDLLPLPVKDWDIKDLRQHLLLYGHLGEPATWVTYGPLLGATAST